MTDEENIKKLEELCEYKGYNYTVITDKDVEALHKAIEALKLAIEASKNERQAIFVVSIREIIDEVDCFFGEDIVYYRYFSSEEKAKTFINNNLKNQIVMTLSKEEVL